MQLLIDHIYYIEDICTEKVERFYNLGLTLNTPIKIKHIQPFNGPVVIETKGRLIALRRRELECLKIK